jgi:hypothetical protein
MNFALNQPTQYAATNSLTHQSTPPHSPHCQQLQIQSRSKILVPQLLSPASHPQQKPAQDHNSQPDVFSSFYFSVIPKIPDYFGFCEGILFVPFIKQCINALKGQKFVSTQITQILKIFADEEI